MKAKIIKKAGCFSLLKTAIHQIPSKVQSILQQHKKQRHAVRHYVETYALKYLNISIAHYKVSDALFKE